MSAHDKIITKTDHNYSFVLMMNALRTAYGSEEAAWDALIQSHKDYVAKAPKELQEALDETFSRNMQRFLQEQ